MSVVAVKVYEDKIEIASDSITLFGNLTIVDKFTKLDKVNSMIIGFVGYLEEGSLMRHYASTRKPKSNRESDILDFMVEFAEWKQSKTKTFSLSNCYIIVYEKKVFYTQDFLVSEISDFFAIGAGQDFATTALYLNHSAVEAVGITCQLCNDCALPVNKFVVKK